MIISGDGVKPDPKIVEALRNATHPDNKAGVMSFLCMLQSNTEFIPKLAQKTVHLRELTKKAVNFHWTKHCQNEFAQLKEALCENALLTYFDPERSTCIFVDAHNTGISAMLCQGETLGEVQMVTCTSRTTTSTERKYPQLDLETLAVDFALRRFRQYIVGGPEVVIITDHKPLVSIFKDSRRGSVRTDRIKLRHQDVSYRIEWQPGVKNPADFMSRHATKLCNIPEEWKEEAVELEKTVCFLNFAPYTEAISWDRIVKETDTDSSLQRLSGYIKKGYIPKTDSNWNPFRNIFDKLTISDVGLILKDDRIILPRSLWKLAVDKAHKGGHPGLTRMESRIRSHFWIPQVYKLVEEKIKGCETCQLFTSKNTKEPQKTCESAWEEVNIDLFGPLPDRKHVLVMQDTMSRFPAATILSSTKAEPVIKAIDKVYTRYGTPQRHRTDNGPPFNSQEFKDFSKLKGVEQVLSYPYHPQENPCETFMKPLGKALKSSIF